MTNKVIQWNCRGLRPNFDELSFLVVRYNHLAVCLQKTFLKDINIITVKGFNLYHKFQEKTLIPISISLHFDWKFQWSPHIVGFFEEVNNRGKQLEDLILKNDLIIFNDKSSTYFHPASDTFTSIDLTLCSTSL